MLMEHPDGWLLVKVGSDAADGVVSSLVGRRYDVLLYKCHSKVEGRSRYVLYGVFSTRLSYCGALSSDLVSILLSVSGCRQ